MGDFTLCSMTTTMTRESRASSWNELKSQNGFTSFERDLDEKDRTGIFNIKGGQTLNSGDYKILRFRDDLDGDEVLPRQIREGLSRAMVKSKEYKISMRT